MGEERVHDPSVWDCHPGCHKLRVEYIKFSDIQRILIRCFGFILPPTIARGSIASDSGDWILSTVID